jgi:magnesium transporter
MIKPRRPRLRVGRYKPAGTAPGTLSVHPEATPPTIHVISYGPDGVQEMDVGDPADLRAMLGRLPVVWVDVHGVEHVETLRAIGEIFELHPLALEDVMSVGQRAKVEPYDSQLFVIIRMPTAHPPETEQVSLVLGQGFVLTFQQRSGDFFDPVRERIRKGGGLIRTLGSDYLTYALFDAVIDSYFPVLDGIGDRLETLEEVVLEEPTQETVADIHETKRTLIALRKVIGPHREAINTLLRNDHGLIGPQTSIFLRDVYDHAIRIAELGEAYRELSSDLMSTYLSALSNRMNEVMKVLTIIASIFIPLSFVAGLYGMNFDPAVSRWNMPELGWPLGYPFALSLMLIIGGGFLWFVWRKGWLS